MPDLLNSLELRRSLQEQFATALEQGGGIDDLVNIAAQALQREDSLIAAERQMHRARQTAIAQERNDWQAQAIANSQRAKKAEAEIQQWKACFGESALANHLTSS